MSGSGAQIPGFTVGDFAQFFLFGIKLVEVKHLVFPIGEEVDMAVEPERIEIDRTLSRDGVDRGFFGVHDEDLRGRAAAVTLPSGGVAKQAVVGRHVNDVGQFALCIGMALKDASLHLFAGGATFDRNTVELTGTPMVGLAPGGEKHIAAVGAPVHGNICSGMPGESGGLASRYGDDVDIAVFLVVGGKCDPLAVG